LPNSRKKSLKRLLQGQKQEAKNIQYTAFLFNVQTGKIESFTANALTHFSSDEMSNYSKQQAYLK
jgi:hypothetical protein